MNLQRAVDRGLVLEHSKQMEYYTDLRLVFKALNSRQVEFNWLITDLECNFYPPPFRSGAGRVPNLWFSGAELTRIVAQYEIQFIWAVLSGFPPHVAVDPHHLEVVPNADGNNAVWSANAKIQHPLAEVEVICWDSSAVLFRSRDPDLMERFQAFFPEAIDLGNYRGEPA
jgi:hypothetical protein